VTLAAQPMPCAPQLRGLMIGTYSAFPTVPASDGIDSLSLQLPRRQPSLGPLLVWPQAAAPGPASPCEAAAPGRSAGAAEAVHGLPATAAPCTPAHSSFELPQLASRLRPATARTSWASASALLASAPGGLGSFPAGEAAQDGGGGTQAVQALSILLASSFRGSGEQGACALAHGLREHLGGFPVR
jgi:hypothetical protein